MQATFVAHDGLNIAYQVDDFSAPWKQPETVLLLHPAMGNSVRWFSWMPALASRYRVVRMDLRGHGNSGTPAQDQPFHLNHLVSDAAQLIDLLGESSVHVVGNSAGGYVAQQLALQHPAKVRTLALYGATPGLKNSQALSWIPEIEKHGLESFLRRTIQDRFDENAPAELVEWFIRQAGSNPPAFIGRFVTHMCSHYFMDDLNRISAPTLIVAAGRESIGESNAYAEMHKRIAGSSLKYIDTAAHNICDGYPDLCVEFLLDFLSAQK